MNIPPERADWVTSSDLTAATGVLKAEIGEWRSGMKSEIPVLKWMGGVMPALMAVIHLKLLVH